MCVLFHFANAFFCSITILVQVSHIIGEKNKQRQWMQTKWTNKIKNWNEKTSHQCVHNWFIKIIWVHIIFSIFCMRKIIVLATNPHWSDSYEPISFETISSCGRFHYNKIIDRYLLHKQSNGIHLFLRSFGITQKKIENTLNLWLIDEKPMRHIDKYQPKQWP